MLCYAMLWQGGSLWVGFRADIKDAANGAMRRSPSRLAALAGVVVEEFESLLAPRAANLTGASDASAARATVWRDGLRPLNGSGAASVWDYTDDFFGGLGLAGVTRRPLGTGDVVHVGCGIEAAALVPLATATLQRAGLVDGPPAHPATVERTRREASADGASAHDVYVNHGATPWTMPSGDVLPPYGVTVTPRG
jgi:hypothetical protein